MAQTASYPPIFDGHNDTILSMMLTGRSFFERSADGHIDLPRALEGRLGGGFFAIYVPPPQTPAAGADAAPGGVPLGPELEQAQSEALSIFGRLLDIAQASKGRINVVRTASRMLEHIDYMVERIGIDHVGLGSDFDGTTVPAELRDAAGLPKLVAAIRARGYTDGDLRKLLQGNWVRVRRETWGG